MATYVWIDDGCIACNMCVTSCPTVFTLPEADALVRGEVREDGCTDGNRERRSPLLAQVAEAEAEALEEAAVGCPMDIIRIER